LAESLLNQKNVPEELYQEFLDDINHEIDREAKIINDLLSLVSLDKNDEILNVTKVNVNELVEGVLRRLKPLTIDKHIELVFESYRNVVAEIDEVKYSLVITNLVENAIKYNREYGLIKVTLNSDHKQFVLSVKDTGIGIPKESQEKIFERFYRVDKTRSRDTGGTGLGLSIVQKTVTIHNGTIICESEEDKGTLFTIKNPLKFIKT
jgi:signal transduction histidine kinase